MQTIAIVSLFLLLATTFATPPNHDNCNYDFDAVLAWNVDKVYAPGVPPYYIGGYDHLSNDLHMSDAEIEYLRQTALAYFKSQFGIPTETGVFNTTTKDTTVAGYGVLQTVFLDDCYRLIASNIPSVGTRLKLKTGEFTFFTDAAAAGLPYGGRMAALYAAAGLPTPTIVAGDSFSVGYYFLYHTQGQERLYRRIQFKGRFPTRQDTPFRAHEELDLFDLEWGHGQSVMQLAVGLSPSFSLLEQINSVWKFPVANDLYTFYGV